MPSSGADPPYLGAGPSRLESRRKHATELVSGVREPASLTSIGGAIRVPVLLIASTEPTELTHDQIYRDGIGSNATLWYIPDAGHVQGLTVHPEEYTARVTAFLQASLAPGA